MTQDHLLGCSCYDCYENRYVGNHTENFDWTDAKIMASKYLAYVQMNPTAIKYAKAAEKIKQAADRAKAAGQKTVVLNAEEKAALQAVKDEEARGKAIVDGIKDTGKGIINFVGSFKWIVFAIVAIVLVTVFIKLKS